MPVAFPDLSKTRCSVFRACGSLLNPSREVVRVLKEARRDEWMRSPTRVGTTSLVVLAAFGGSGASPSRHVHVDVAMRDSFGRSLPGKSVPIAAIRDVLDRLAGQQIILRLCGMFVIGSGNQIPAIVKATSFSSKAGDLELSTRSVSLDVQGAPIREINWRRRENDDLEIWLEADLETIIDEQYLLQGFEVIQSGFRAIIVGESPREIDA